MSKAPILYTGDDEIELPFVWEICGHCEGHGKSSAYLGAYTSSEWAEQDEEFKEDYVAGRYDRACERCGGSGKVRIADRSRMTAEQIEAWDAQCEDDRLTHDIERQERLFEGGWREEGWYGS